jgi:hypothetical protein
MLQPLLNIAMVNSGATGSLSLDVGNPFRLSPRTVAYAFLIIFGELTL